MPVPLLLASGLKGLAASYGPQILARLFGAGRSEEDYLNELQRLMNPDNMAGFIGRERTLLNQAAAPARAGILTSANAFQNNLVGNLAATGMNRSGIGALAATAASSVGANTLNRLNADIGQQSVQFGREDFQNNIRNFMLRGPRPNGMADTIGAGTGAFRTYLMGLLNKGGSPARLPQVSGAMAPPVGQPNVLDMLRGQYPRHLAVSRWR